MKKVFFAIAPALLLSLYAAGTYCDSCKMKKSTIEDTDYKITSASVTHNKKWGQLEF